MGKIIAVNISEEKGTPKKNIHSANLIEDWGVEHDAHAGKWHRQVSLLSYEKIEDFKDRVSKASYDGINKELARKALVEYLDDVIGRLQKDIIVHRG